MVYKDYMHEDLLSRTWGQLAKRLAERLSNFYDKVTFCFYKWKLWK